MGSNKKENYEGKNYTLAVLGVVIAFVVAVVAILTFLFPEGINRGNREDSPYVDITGSFTDPSFLEAVREVMGKSSDEAIFNIDAESITELWVYGRNIYSLDGIEYFVNLRRLIVSNNNLTRLDTSSNPNLEEIDAHFNQLVELNVSNNHRLQFLWVQLNQLSILDVTNNPMLTRLAASQNELRTIDISNNPQLRALYLSDNDLVSIDISNNRVLDSLHVDGNPLRNIDITNNPFLETLFVSGDYPYNPNKLIFEGLEGNPIWDYLNEFFDPAQEQWPTWYNAINAPAFSDLFVGGLPTVDYIIGLEHHDFDFREYLNIQFRQSKLIWRFTNRN